ncbi:MAG: DUF2786 domain-containing protein [Deltaproteobacteria bacterium]|nr:DUF2786 domain-containing protein [Deltaproteobacteria bacterium]
MSIPRPPAAPPTLRPPAQRDRERVAKLLALAQDQAGQPEGELAAEKARALLRRLALDRADEPQGAGPERDPYLRRARPLGAPSPWRRRLAASVAAHCACVCAWTTATDQVVLFGRESALQICDYLIEVLMREVVERRDGWRAEHPDASGAEINGFCHSAVTAIEHRLRDSRAEERRRWAEANALVRHETQQLEDWLSAQGLDWQPARPAPYGFSGDGYAAGHAIPVHGGVDATRWRAVGGA